MTGATPEPHEPTATGSDGSLLPKNRWGRAGHLLFWTALFYVLAWGIAKLCEWLSS